MVVKRKRGLVFCILMILLIVAAAGCKEHKKQEKGPKYIFLLIGDGMGYSQIQLASDYLGSIANPDAIKNIPLSFMQFPYTGSVTNYDTTSYIPDSASSGTALASGEKTTTGTINRDKLEDISYETIAEYLKRKLGYKVGIISSANINHTTPAAFYAHRNSRSEEYQIGLELINSNFDYFGGGGMRGVSQEEIRKLYLQAQDAGYHILKSSQNAVLNKQNKYIVVAREQAENQTMPYVIDADNNSWKLKDYVSNATKLLQNKTGFFMVVEGGKIDWACHSNDAATCVKEVLDFNDAVKMAYSFYEKYPKDTLILVTPDHETGGLTLCSKESGYDTNFYLLENQKISFRKYEDEYVEIYKKNKTTFENVLKDIHDLFGLEQKEKNVTNIEMILTEVEVRELREAYQATLSMEDDKQKKLTEEQYLLYGKYDPLTITILRIMSDKAGVSWSTFAHTASPVPIYAIGNGADKFSGCYDNTEVYQRLKKLVS